MAVSSNTVRAAAGRAAGTEMLASTAPAWAPCRTRATYRPVGSGDVIARCSISFTVASSAGEGFRTAELQLLCGDGISKRGGRWAASLARLSAGAPLMAVDACWSGRPVQIADT